MAYNPDFQYFTGSPHCHILLWLDGAPLPGSPDYLEFLDRNVSCSTDTWQKELVLKYQNHKHSSTCLKNSNSECRFDYPKKEAAKTRIFDDDEIEKHNGKFYELKRTKNEMFINNYHPIILQMVKCNMDIQPVVNEKAVVYYIAKYMSKSEPSEIRKETQDLLKKAQNVEGENKKQKLVKECMKIMRKRQVSTQEAAFRICHLPLHKSSRKTTWVPAYPKQDRVRMIDKNTINSKNPKFYTNIIEKYAMRPMTPEFEPMCLFEFASFYQPVYGNKSVDLDQDLEEERREVKPAQRKKRYKLLNSNIIIEKRTKFSIVKYPNFHPVTEKEKYYNSMLLLYLPFREENFLDGFGSAAEAFKHHHPNLRKTADNEIIQFDWADELNRCVLQLLDNFPENFDKSDIDSDILENFFDSQEETTETVKPVNKKVDAQEIQRRIRSLNKEQLKVFQKWRRKINSKSTTPLRLVVTGSGGTGKSFLINLFRDYINKTSKDPDGINVILGAPTGVSAMNISGSTIHSLFHLGVEKSKVPKYTKLKNKQLLRLRSQYKNVQLIIIDEYSMISYETLRHLHLRFQEIFDSEELFGGQNIIFFGDPLQLKPCNGSFIFQQPPYFSHEPNLWHEFEYAFLNTAQRQKQSDPLLGLLNRLREGKMTGDDIQMLTSNVIDPSRPDYEEKLKEFEDAIRLVPTVEMADNQNEAKTKKLEEKTKVYEINAIDSYASAINAFKKPPESHIPTKKKECAGVPSKIKLGIGSRVMLIRNSNVSGGLCNGAMGTVTGFQWPSLRRDQREVGEQPDAVFVKFDNQVNPLLLEADGTCKIVPKNVEFPGQKGPIISRLMFQLVLCWAVTVHKVQSLSLDKAVVYLGKEIFCKGQAYTALSRVRSFKGLGIIELLPSKLLTKNKIRNKKNYASGPTNPAALEEIQRMKTVGCKEDKVNNIDDVMEIDFEQELELCPLPIFNATDKVSKALPEINTTSKSGTQSKSVDTPLPVNDNKSKMSGKTSSSGDILPLTKLSFPPPKPRPLQRPNPTDVQKFLEIPDWAFGSGYGIEWNNNSCYLESVIVSLFYGRDDFDFILEPGENDSTSIKSVKRILLSMIQVLRADHFLPSSGYSPLRKKLVEITGNQDYVSHMMDASEFLSSLFDSGLGISGLYSHMDGSVRLDYLLSPALRSRLPDLSTMQDVIHHDMSHHKFPVISRPVPGLIVVKARELPPSQQNIVPSPEITITLSDGGRITMNLTSIICHRRAHFVTYFRDSISWLYAPGLSAPVVRMPNLAMEIQSLIQDPKKISENQSRLKDICENGYIYIYN